MSDVEADLDRSPSAARTGKAAEHLGAASRILVPRGELNVSTSFVDDEGVDLVFNRLDSSTTPAVPGTAGATTDSSQRR